MCLDFGLEVEGEADVKEKMLKVGVHYEHWSYFASG